VDGSQKDKLTKPFDSTKKPWKKPGSGNSDQISHLTEEIAKLKKRLKQNLRSTRNVRVTRRTMIPTVARIMGPVARVDQ
jgi:hypothetical protein